MGKIKLSVFRAVLGLAALITTGTSFAAEECQICRERSMLNELVQATSAVVERGANSCGQTLSQADQQDLARLRAALLKALGSAKGDKERARAISKTFAAHEKNLSPLAIATILSESARVRVAVIQEGLKSNPKLAKAMTDFEKVATEHIKSRSKINGGLKGLEKDDKKLEAAAARLKKAIKQSAFDEISKRTLEKNMYALQSLAYKNSSNRAQKEGDRASLYMALLLIPKGLLSLELVAASYFGMTTPAGAGAKVVTQILTKAASGAAGSAGFSDLSSTGRMLGYAAVGKPENGAYFCRLSDEITRQGPEARKRALTAAILGGAFGAGYGGVAAVNYTAARALAGVGSGLFAASSGRGAFDSHKKAQQLEMQAEEAQKRGDLAAAAALREQAQRAKVDTAAGSIETLMFAFGSVKLTPRLGKGLVVKTAKSPAKSSQPVRVISSAAKSKSAADVCPIKPTSKKSATSKKTAVGAASAAAAGSLAGCGGGEPGDTSVDPGDTPIDDTPPGDTPTDPVTPSCADSNSCMVRLSWDPPVPSDPPVPVAGYKIYWGTSPGLYTNSIDVGNQLNAEVPGLGAGTYYFAATAYSQETVESGFSNVVSTTFGQSAVAEPQAAAARITIGEDGQQQVEPADPAGL